MLMLNRLCKSLGDKPVIADLTFAFPARGMFALMGPSGCGKTTLLRLLCGLEEPDSGTVENTFYKTAVAFQEPRLLPWLNAVQNIELVLPKTAESRVRAAKSLHTVELDGAAELFPAQLSGGMRGRLSLARALAYGGDLLLLDEPFSGLDAALSERLATHIRAANPEGLTLVVTHNHQEAELLGARILTVVGTPFSGLTLTEET